MSHSLKPGVVTGEDYQTLLRAAKEGGYALPAVNAVGTNSVNAVMEAAAKNKSDVSFSFPIVVDSSLQGKVWKMLSRQRSWALYQLRGTYTCWLRNMEYV